MLTLQLLTSFIAGGVFIALQTLMGERLHDFWRGAVLTIPSTMGMGLLFIGIAKSPLDVVEAVRIIPAALGPSYLLAMTFAVLIRSSLAVRLLGGLIAWAASVLTILQFPPASFFIACLIGLPIVLLAYLVVRRLPQIPHLKPFPMKPGTILVRSILGGTIVVLAVILAKTTSNMMGGLFATFPAVFSSTLIIFYSWHGSHVIPSAVKSLFFPGYPGFVIYAGLTALTYPLWGIWFGTLAAYGGTFLFFVVCFIGKSGLVRLLSLRR